MSVTDGPVDWCPVCGERGLRACVDSDGNPMDTDHRERPTAIPDWLRIVPPYKKS